MLSEISQRDTNTVCYYLYVESKEANLIKTESRMAGTKGKGKGIREFLFKCTNLQLVDK